MSTRLAGVIGWPIAHSLSPRMHTFWLREQGIDGAYVPLPVERPDFARAVMGLARAGFAGLNVTIPHKQAAFALAHEADEAARDAGAANLLLFKEGGRIEARNTDALGLAASLASELGPDCLRGKVVVVAGAGGAARAALVAFGRMGASEIRIIARKPERADALVRSVSQRISAQMQTVLWSDWGKTARDAALFVNATSAGMAGNPRLDLSLDPLAQTAAVFDMVYNPLETPLLKAARTRGHRVIDGLGMLMHQALPAFAAFYGVMPSVTPALRAELEKALQDER